MSGSNSAGRTAPDAGDQNTGSSQAADLEAARELKKALRHEAREHRSTADPAELAHSEPLIRARVLDLVRGRIPAQSMIACYLSTDNEPDTHRLVVSLTEMGFRVMVPYMRGGPAADDIDWAWFQGPDKLERGALGIDRPTGSPLGIESLGEAQVVIMPGLAGGRDGSRLGMGAGWYDRALTHCRPGALRWLLLYDDEVRDSLPQGAHDQRMDVIVTPRRTIVAADTDRQGRGLARD